jgi:hypothetical protein
LDEEELIALEEFAKLEARLEKEKNGKEGGAAKKAE